MGGTCVKHALTDHDDSALMAERQDFIFERIQRFREELQTANKEYFVRQK